MKKYPWLLSLIFLFLLSGCQQKGNNQQPGTLTNSDTANFWILTDSHFLDPDLHDDGKEFQFIKATAAGKDLDYQAQSLEALVAEAKKAKPTALILTGDLTLNGELASAKAMAKILAPLEKSGIPIIAIPGNHDLYDGWARAYQGNEKTKVAQISPADFQKIFPAGFEKAYTKDKNSLSYAIHINKNYDFFFLDTNEYGIEPTTSAPRTSGQLKADTLDWLEKNLAQSNATHKIPLVFMHHNLYKHNPLVYQGYVLSNADELLKVLRDYQVPGVFSGHIHAQDIMQDQSNQQNPVEVVTSSFAIADHGFGELKLSGTKASYQRKTVNVDTWAKETQQTDKNLLNHQQYLKELFLKDGVRMAYQQLLDKGIYDEKILEPVADLVGQANYDYFTGNDQKNQSELNKLKEATAYQDMRKYSPFLTKYLDYILNDTNLNDQKVTIHE